MSLCINSDELPWVTSAKHLGTSLETSLSGMTKDLMEKRAIFINRNNELVQEFRFAHPQTLIKVNSIYNTSFYGCVLWDLFSKEAERLEKTWNVSQRLMLGLSRESHRYFIEPISETRHIIFHIYKRFVKFLSQMTSSRKGILRSLCNVVMNDCQSTTGRNLRRLQLLFNSGSFTELQRDVKTNRAYQEADVNDLWKIEAVKDLTNAMYDNTILPNFTRDEISDIRDHIATY